MATQVRVNIFMCYSSSVTLCAVGPVSTCLQCVLPLAMLRPHMYCVTIVHNSSMLEMLPCVFVFHLLRSPYFFLRSSALRRLLWRWHNGTVAQCAQRWNWRIPFVPLYLNVILWSPQKAHSSSTLDSYENKRSSYTSSLHSVESLCLELLGHSVQLCSNGF